MHFCNAYILRSQMFSITFSKGKCSAKQNVTTRQNAFCQRNATHSVVEHFPLENVMLCKNAFDAKMLCFLLCKKQRCVHFVTQNVTNAFDAKMHLMPKCILATRTFSKGKCSAYIFLWKMFSVHFPKENVQQRCAKMHLMPKCILATHHIFQRKMFSITFSKGKCSASLFFAKQKTQHFCTKNKAN